MESDGGKAIRFRHCPVPAIRSYECLKQSARFSYLTGISCVCGIVAAVVRSVYFKTAVDSEGYLSSPHPMQILFWILAVCMILTSILFCRKLPRVKRPAPLGIRTGALQVLLAASMALTVWNLPGDLRFYVILRILGWAAAAALLADGILRCFQKKLGIFSHSLLCVFLLMYIIDNYSHYWSNEPEMERILVPAVGLILLLPLSCELAFWDLGKNSDSRIVFLEAITGFFCLASVGCPTLQPLNLGGAVWAFNALLSMRTGGETK